MQQSQLPGFWHLLADSEGVCTGRLAKEWGEIPGLQHLNLSDNSLAGALPKEWAGLFSQLATLDLSFNLINDSLPHGVLLNPVLSMCALSLACCLGHKG